MTRLCLSRSGCEDEAAPGRGLCTVHTEAAATRWLKDEAARRRAADPLGWEFDHPPVPPPPAFRQVARALWDHIPPAVWLSHISAAPVLIDGAGYQMHEDGEWAFLTPIRTVPGPLWRLLVWGCGCSPADAWQAAAATVDVVAWHPATPGRWARRSGMAAMLGEVEADQVLRVHRTPLSWLAAGGEGVCFLEPDPAEIALTLGMASQVIAEDEAHARALRRICERPRAVPRITA